jgi:hypothetical protein
MTLVYNILYLYSKIYSIIKLTHIISNKDMLLMFKNSVSFMEQVNFCDKNPEDIINMTLLEIHSVEAEGGAKITGS